MLLRLTYGAYPQLQAHWLLLVWIMAALSMTVGNLGALRQHSVKRMLAYSSIAHAGYTLVAFTALSSEGIAAAMFYTATYAAMNVGAFAVVSHAGGYDDRLVSVADYRGLAYRSPLLGGALAFFLLSLIGIPFTGGFFGKFYVFTAALHSGEVWLAVIGLREQRCRCLLLSAPAHVYLWKAHRRRARAIDSALERVADLGSTAHCLRHRHPRHLPRQDSSHGPSRSSHLRRRKPNQSIACTVG